MTGSQRHRSVKVALLGLAFYLILALGTLVPAAESQDTESVFAGSRASVAAVGSDTPGGVSIGSAFAAADRLALTAHHVIRDARRVIVRFPDYPPVDARVVATDSVNDLAVLAIPALPVRPLPLGDVAQVREGQRIVVIGYPRPEILGVQTPTVTEGIVSAVRGGLLQIQAAISPGNSGGPILNMRGEVIGIVVGSLRGPQQGINFASAVNAAKPLIGHAVLSTLPLTSPTEFSPPSAPTPPSAPQPVMALLPDGATGWTIMSATGIGPLRIGARRDQIEVTMGVADETRVLEDWVVSFYRKYGLAVGYGGSSRLVDFINVGTGSFAGVTPTSGVAMLRSFFATPLAGC
ncbi:MAG: trypsin-like peptidase domain-containing protein [Armatimonadota bacterium]|nr:trypsin-like peptidase domain-containing protein [Armatimonadota bacterium]